ncbi:MAG: hypothetical protein HC898_07505 [Phycisphaerales bacterium]|nr:hypothetical protein [Phycisphaerales bacterium]
MPGIIGLLLAGLLLGPNALNLMDRGDTMKLFGSVGLLYIMFVAGLEINLRLFNQYKLHTGLFGLLTFALPQGLGALVNYYLLGMDWPVAILLASMFASHTLLPYPLMGRFGILKNRAVVCTGGGDTHHRHRCTHGADGDCCQHGRGTLHNLLGSTGRVDHHVHGAGPVRVTKGGAEVFQSSGWRRACRVFIRIGLGLHLCLHRGTGGHGSDHRGIFSGAGAESSGA